MTHTHDTTNQASEDGRAGTTPRPILDQIKAMDPEVDWLDRSSPEDAGPFHPPLWESFDVPALVEQAFNLTVRVRVKDEDDEPCTTRRSDMLGFADMCHDWFTRALDQLAAADEIQVPSLLFVYRDGKEFFVKLDKATEEDFDHAMASRMTEAMAYLAEAWWSVQQAAMVHATRDLPRRADA